MTDPTPIDGERRRHVRRLVAVLALAVVLLVALAALTLRRPAPAAADCDKKPPPNAFAVPSCDESAATAAKPASQPAAGAPRP